MTEGKHVTHSAHTPGPKWLGALGWDSLNCYQKFTLVIPFFKWVEKVVEGKKTKIAWTLQFSAL